MMFRFENAERKIDRVESESESISMGRTQNLADQIAGLEDDDRVEAELAELKSKVSDREADSKKEDSNE